eukprot:756043-Hanusia_phi.AAC.2
MINGFMALLRLVTLLVRRHADMGSCDGGDRGQVPAGSRTTSRDGGVEERRSTGLYAEEVEMGRKKKRRRRGEGAGAGAARTHGSAAVAFRRGTLKLRQSRNFETLGFRVY